MIFLPTTKDKVEDEDKSGIYEVQCKDCTKLYIGQTRRKLATRFKEHCSHIKHNRSSKSAVALHALEFDHLDVNKECVTLKKHVSNPLLLNAWESIYMYQNKTKLMNTDVAPINSPLFNFL